MSAAEKLRALNEAATSAPWWAENPGNIPGGWTLHSPDGESRGVDGSVIATLRNALPQIVAVVEAAEQGERYTNRDLERPFGGERNSWMETESLDAALSALDEALS